MNKENLIPLAALACIILLVSGVAYALYSWSQTVNWSWQNADASFEVTGASTVNFGTIIESVNQTQTLSYTVVNTGNLDITVEAVFEGTGATVTWDKTEQTLIVGGSALFTATFLITGAGSGTVSFNMI